MTILYWSSYNILWIIHKKKKKCEYLLDIINRCGSYIILLFHNLVIFKNIFLFWLPFYFTYPTQSLNVEDCQLFKHYHTNAIDKVIRLSNKKIDKHKLFCNKMFKSSTIQHAFKSTGLVTCNSDVLYDKKQAQKPKTALQTPSSSPLQLNHRTSQPLASVVKYGQNLQRAYAKLETVGKNQPGAIITIHSQIDCLSAYIRTDYMRFETGTRGYNCTCKTRKSWWTSCSERWDYKSQWVLRDLFEDKGKRERTNSEEKSERKSRRRNRQILSWLKLNFLSGGPHP